MSRFAIGKTALAGLAVVQRQRLSDSRGFLSRIFCAEELAAAGWTVPIAQINHTLTSRKGTVRGMHFQHPPHAEAKLVSCLRGSVFDVAVDLRHGSPSFLHWHGVELSAANGRALLIPPGFAHGFQALTDDAELLYCHSSAYTPAAEGAVHPLDPTLAIEWPLAVAELSERDANHPRIDGTFEGVVL